MSKTLHVGLMSEVGTLDPELAWDVGTMMIIMQFLESPYGFSIGGDPPQPLLFAEPLRLERIGEAFVYSASLRPGTRFADGQSVTPADVVGSLERLSTVNQRATVEVDGDRILFRCATEQPDLASLLGPQNALVYRRSGDTFMGTGPFQVAAHSPAEIRLTRNPHYSGDVPLDEIVFRAYRPDPDGGCQALCQAIRDGEVDFSNVLTRDDIMGLAGVRKHIVTGNSTCILYLNTERPPFDGVALRRAIALSLDRLELAKTCYTNALAFRATSIVPRVLGVADDGHRRDLERARLLLAELDVSIPSPLKLLTVWAPRPYLPKPAALGEALVGQLAELGLEVELVVATGREDYVRATNEGDYDMLLGGWVIESPYLAVFLEQLLSSHCVPGDEDTSGSGANFSRWKSESADRLIEAYHSNPVDEVRDQILDVVSTEVPMIPLIYGSAAIATSFRVRNFRSSPENLFDYRVFHLDVDDA